MIVCAPESMSGNDIVHQWIPRIGVMLIVLAASSSPAAQKASGNLAVEIESLPRLGIPAFDHIEAFGPLRGSAVVSLHGARVRLDRLDACVNARGAKLSERGSIADAARWRGLDLRFELTAPSARWFVDAAAPAAGALTFRGRVTTEDELLRFSDLTLTTPSSNLYGWLALESDRARPRVIGRLHASMLDLDEFWSRDHGRACDSGRLLPADPLSLLFGRSTT